MAGSTSADSPPRKLSKRRAPTSSAASSPASIKSGTRTPAASPPSLLSGRRSTPTVAVSSPLGNGTADAPASRPASIIFPSAGGGDDEDDGFGTLRTSLRSRLDSDASARARRTSNSSFDEAALARARTGSFGSLNGSAGQRAPNKLRKKGQMPMPSASTAEDLARMGGPPSPNADSVLSHITFDGDTSTETEAPAEETSTEEERLDKPASPERVRLTQVSESAESTFDLHDEPKRRSIMTTLIAMPVTLPLRIASSIPLVGRLVPSFARPEPLFDERDNLLGLPVRVARGAFDLGLSVAVWALFTIGGQLSSKPRAEMAH